jgi:hypothetical protein
MEFGGIPQQKETSRSGAPRLIPALAPAKVSRAPSVRAVSAAKPSARKGRIVAAAIALLVVGGGSLEVLTPYGAFGRHALLDLLNADKFAAEQAGAIDSARRLLASDTFADTKRAIARGRRGAKSPRVTGLLTYGAFVGYLPTSLGRSRTSTLTRSLPGPPTNRWRSPSSRAAQNSHRIAAAARRQVLESLPRATDRTWTWRCSRAKSAPHQGRAEALDDFSRAASLDGGGALVRGARAGALA